jgi:hypothetical protein
LEFDDTGRTITLDFFAKLPASGTGDISMGFCTGNSEIDEVYNSTARSFVGFALRGSTGVLYANATDANGTPGVTNTDISSGLTLTVWNHYRIEVDLGAEVARYYVNGTLKATHSGTNVPGTVGDNISFGFGRSDTALFQVTAPTFSVKLR